MTKVVAINGSPRMEKGNTAALLAAFLEGMREVGADVDVAYAARLDVKPCTGEMHCWYTKPGECYLKDGMQELYPALSQAELLVLATPVYIPLPGEMQNVINRLCPLVEPRLHVREGRTRARFRDHVAIRQIALVSTGAWWERENMDTVLRVARELAEDASVPFAGALLRPHAFLMKQDGRLTPAGEAVLRAAGRAGRELITEGRMRQETLDAVSCPLIAEEELRRRYNAALPS